MKFFLLSLLATLPKTIFCEWECDLSGNLVRLQPRNLDNQDVNDAIYDDFPEWQGVNNRKKSQITTMTRGLAPQYDPFRLQPTACCGPYLIGGYTFTKNEK